MKTEIRVRLGMGEDSYYVSTQQVDLAQYETNCITELFIDNFLEYIPIENVMGVLSIWKTKLRHGSKLIITGTDIVQVCKACLSKTLKVPQINTLLYGNSGQFNCCLSLDDVTSLLENLELKILNKKLSDMKYTIIAERP